MRRARIAAALDSGTLIRPRRGWVALPDADIELVAAARAGVVLSCITAARRRSLWVLEETEYHVAAAPHARGGKRPGAHVHWAQPVVPRHPDALVDGVENMLAIVSACQPFEPALAVWESALRVGLVTKTALEMLPFHHRAREILAVASPYSDSGLESFIVPRLKWMRVRIIPQAWLLGHRVDFLIGDRLILQIDGGHHMGAQRLSDNAHDALLMINGFHVIRVGYSQIVGDWARVQDVIMRAVAQGLHLAK